MKLVETGLPGAYLLELEPHVDARGFFARTFCAGEFDALGLQPTVAQCSLSYNARRGTLRGLHLQRPPAAEAKLVRCISGAIYDVIVDLRPASPTYLSHVGVELSARNRCALYVPEQFAHGFQTLTDDAEILYQINTPYVPELSSGVRHDDPSLGIRWPLPVDVISERDLAWPLLDAGAARDRPASRHQTGAHV